MKLFTIFLFIFVLLPFHLIGVDYGIDLKLKIEEYDIPVGNPYESKILEQNKNYIVIFNPTPFSYRMMKSQATNLCVEINNDEDNIARSSFLIGVYTAYYVCGPKNLYENENETNIEYLFEKDFMFKIREQHFERIEALEKKAEEKRLQKQLNIITKRIIDTCKNYQFAKGSDLFNTCILELMKIQTEKEAYTIFKN